MTKTCSITKIVYTPCFYGKIFLEEMLKTSRLNANFTVQGDKWIIGKSLKLEQIIIITTILISNMFKGKLQFLRYESGGDASSAPNRTSFISYGDFKGGRKMFVGENSLLRVLYLPDGTLITEELRAFARCLASAKYLSVTNKLDYCWCFGGMTYGSLFLWSIFNCFIGVFHTLVTLVHMDGDCSKINLQISLTNVCQLPWTLLKFLFWLFLSSYASYYNFTWMDDVILPSPNVENRTNRPVPYFRRPWMWHAVIFLAWIYCFSCLAEILLILIVGS
uniref:Uncharacterized protein n=1 Tax=Romanomermis culicivorax TaxID=13658 RepID=A0A915I656_ROMCU